jgi:hypothetical protein
MSTPIERICAPINPESRWIEAIQLSPSNIFPADPFIVMANIARGEKG